MSDNTRHAILPPPYYMGRKARTENKPKSYPPHYGMTMRHWWLAGWNDCDMELMA